MRILFVNYEYPPLGGGAGVSNKLLAEELAKRHEVVILTSHKSGLNFQEKHRSLEIFRVPVLMRRHFNTASMPSLLSYPISALFKGLHLCSKKKFDIVQSFFALPSGVVGLALAKVINTPHVLSLRGGDVYDPTRKNSPYRNRFIGHAVKQVINHSDKVTTLSEDMVKKVYKYNLCSNSKKIGVIRNAINPSAMEVRANGNRKSNVFTIVTMGRLVERKGIDYLIKAYAKLNYKKSKLFVVGEGPQKMKLIDLSRSLGVSGRVIFTGKLEKERFSILNNADCFCLPSLYESFGVVYLEAMYYGLPIIACKVGGPKSFLQEGKTGFFVPTKNINLITNFLVKLIKNKPLRKRISGYNKRYVKNFFISKTAKEYERMYRDVVNKF